MIFYHSTTTYKTLHIYSLLRIIRNANHDAYTQTRVDCTTVKDLGKPEGSLEYVASTQKMYQRLYFHYEFQR